MEVARYVIGSWIMARPRKDDGLTKFQRYRAVRKHGGMKLVRLWVPDPQAPGFAEEAKRQAALLIGADEEADALDFIERAADWDERGG
jgi:hypothetical protein